MILLSPGPCNITEGVRRALLAPDICPREPTFGVVLDRVRSGLGRLAGGQPGDYTAVLLCGSGTAAVEAMLASVVGRDAHLLILENGAYGRRLVELAEGYGLPHAVASFGPGRPLALEVVAAHLGQGRTTHLALVHHETSSGMLNPLPEVAALCRAHGVQVLVDAMSSFGAIPLELAELGVDYLAASSGKCLQGVPGLSFVIAPRARLAALRSVPGRSTYLDLAEQHRFFEVHGQLRFTPPVQVVYALERALEELFEETVAGRHRRYLDSWRVLDSGVRQLGFARLLPPEQLSRIVTAYVEPDHPRYSYVALHRELAQRGFTIYPGKGTDTPTFRLANMGAIGPPEMARFVAALSDALDTLGVALDPGPSSGAP